MVIERPRAQRERIVETLVQARLRTHGASPTYMRPDGVLVTSIASLGP